MASETTAPREQRWKTNNRRADKAGPHRTVYWVKPKKAARPGEGADKGGGKAGGGRKDYELASTYQGSWLENKKHGYGTQVYRNGNQYEGDWAAGRREGHGTLFVRRGDRLVKVYAGGWRANRKHGLGVQYYKDGSRYEGEWEGGVRHGTGSMWYENGDVYVGEWANDKRCGNGTMTYANGNVYEGGWLSDLREGAGIYFFAAKNKVLDAEWAADVARCSVYVDAAAFFGQPDETAPGPGAKRTDATGAALLARFRGGAARLKEPLPELGLADVDRLLAERVDEIQRERGAVRELAEVPLTELFGEEELDILGDIFDRHAAAAFGGAGEDAFAGGGGEGRADDEGRVAGSELGALLADAGFPLRAEDVARVVVDLGAGQRVADLRLAFADYVRAVHLARGVAEAADGGGAPAEISAYAADAAEDAAEYAADAAEAAAEAEAGPEQ